MVMRQIKIFVLVVLALFLENAVNSSVIAYKVEVTDRAGGKFILKPEKQLFYSSMFKVDKEELLEDITGISEFIRLDQNTKPMHCYWISLCFIKEIYFTYDDPSAVKMKIVFFNDSTLTGSPALKYETCFLEGIGEYGKTRVYFNKIKSLRILSYINDDPGKSDKDEITMAEAISYYKNNSSKLFPDSYGVDLKYLKFRITDGKKTYSGYGLYFSDKYEKPKEDANFIYHNQYVERYDHYYGIKLEKGENVVNYDFDRLSGIVFTGNQIEQSPQIRLFMEKGDSVTGRMMTLEKLDINKEYGRYENEDIFCWWIDAGFEGLSALPFRKMRISFKK